VTDAAPTPVTGMANHAHATPDRPALRVGSETRTYRDLADRSARLARHFRDLGAQPGDTVAVMLPNGFDFFEAAAAACRAELYFLPVNWHLKENELAHILEDSGAKVLVAHESLAEHFGPAVERVDGCATVMADKTDWSAFEPLPGDGWASPAFIFYTSGTTGQPKGVVHSALDPARMGQSQQMLAALWGIRPDDVYLLAGPAYHAGPGGWAFTTLFVGGMLSIMESWDARAGLAQIERDRCTISFLTPAHFIRILEVPPDERAKYDLSSFRLVIHGGAPCPVPVKRGIIDALPATEVWELYGASEGGATRVSPGEWSKKPGTVGLPWPGVELRILDDNGERCAPGVSGVIYIAPGGAAGSTFYYHRDEAKTDAAWRDGAFTVGDVGYLDEDGYLFITDRVSDMVIRNGVNIYPREVENVLYQHPGVVDCAVFGMPDDRQGEVLYAVVEPRDQWVTADDLEAFCREHLSDFKCPSTFELVDVLPRDPNGKVLKRHLKAARLEAQETTE